MKTIVIIGAGQMGRAVAKLLNYNHVKLLGFGDNDPSLWGGNVTSIENAVKRNPDEIIISVFALEKASQLTAQIEKCGFKGRIVYLRDFHFDFDLRSSCIKSLCERINACNISGCVAELGVYKGDTAWQINEMLPNRRLYLFDTFEGFPDSDIAIEKKQEWFVSADKDFSDTSEEAVVNRLPYPETVIVRKGYFPETALGLENESFALVSMDVDLYAPTLAGLKFFYPRLNQGGAIVIHDYNSSQFSGVKRAVNEFERIYGMLNIVSLGDLHGSCVVMK